jgi:alkylation response protein AidB-like acyl-CoA dehydrogenase
VDSLGNGATGEWADDEAFRDEVRTFVRHHLRPEISGGPRTGRLHEIKAQQAWHKILAAQGWVVPSWPLEYGGTGWSLRRRQIFAEELTRAKAPPLSPFLNMIGPVLYTFGTEAQKVQHLPGLRSGEVTWCQGYSEPGAGSDLAALATRAVRDGDEYVVNGQKIWTTYAHVADWIFCLVRTSSEGKAQAGISFLLIDLTSPGIRIRPILSIDGRHHLNDVFFTDVHVPAANLIGEENRGWEYAKFLLQHERGTVGDVTTLRVQLDDLRELAASLPGEEDGTTLADDRAFLEDLAHAEIDVIAFDCLSRRHLQRHSRGEDRDEDASLLKLRHSEIEQRLSELAIDTLGNRVAPDHVRTMAGQPAAEPAGAPQAITDYLFCRAATILAGSSEIQRGIIAKAVLSRGRPTP